MANETKNVTLAEDLLKYHQELGDQYRDIVNGQKAGIVSEVKVAEASGRIKTLEEIMNYHQVRYKAIERIPLPEDIHVTWRVKTNLVDLVRRAAFWEIIEESAVVQEALETYFALKSYEPIPPKKAGKRILRKK